MRKGWEPHHVWMCFRFTSALYTSGNILVKHETNKKTILGWIRGRRRGGEEDMVRGQAEASVHPGGREHPTFLRAD